MVEAKHIHLILQNPYPLLQKTLWALKVKPSSTSGKTPQGTESPPLPGADDSSCCCLSGSDRWRRQHHMWIKSTGLFRRTFMSGITQVIKPLAVISAPSNMCDLGLVLILVFTHNVTSFCVYKLAAVAKHTILSLKGFCCTEGSECSGNTS